MDVCLDYVTRNRWSARGPIPLATRSWSLQQILWRARGRGLPSPTPTALQVSPYDNCAPVRDICMPIMLNRPYYGSTLQVAGTCVTRGIPPPPGQVVGGYWGNGLVEGPRARDRPVGLPDLLFSSTDSSVDQTGRPGLSKGLMQTPRLHLDGPHSHDWEWRRGRKGELGLPQHPLETLGCQICPAEWCPGARTGRSERPTEGG